MFHEKTSSVSLCRCVAISVSIQLSGFDAWYNIICLFLLSVVVNRFTDFNELPFGLIRLADLVNFVFQILLLVHFQVFQS